jgi:hypothetical protein
LELREALLPSLSRNIVCGNSLLDPSAIGKDMFRLDEEIIVNPLSFAAAFPEVMEAGGFDAIVGNPPYYSIDDTWGKKDPKPELIKKSYPEVHTDKTDILF